jgi:hypothetical protein
MSTKLEFRKRIVSCKNMKAEQQNITKVSAYSLIIAGMKKDRENEPLGLQ